ncbi:MAG TPA: PAS domain S-box protein [Acidimicrobiales bacterium]|nr:PAS domain S-box protein [Acidimicrobiales bacterium]
MSRTRHEAHVAAIVASSGSAIVTIDLDGMVTSWNAGAERMLGRPAEEMIGRAVETVVMADHRHRVTRSLKQTVRAHQSWQAEIPAAHADGSVIDVAATVSPVLDAGRLVELVIVGVDVTEHRLAEQALHQREQQLAEAQRVARLGSWNWDVGSDTVDWSDELFRIFGVNPSLFDATFAGYLSLVHPDDRPMVEAIVGEAFEGRDSFELDHRIVQGDGTVVWVQARGAVERDESGAPLRMAGTAQDVSERRHADEVRYRLAAIVDSSDDAIFSCSLDGTVLSWNNGAAMLYGYSAEEMVGQAASVLVPADHAGEVAVVVAAAQGGGAVHGFRTVQGRKDGSLVAVALTVSRIPNAEGAIVATSTIARDITERKRLEAEVEAARDQALEVSRLKSNFLATMSHEIRTPMNGVIGMTGLLLDTDLDAEQRDFTQTVRRSGEALLDIINDILDFSKIEAGKLDLEVIDFDLRHVVEEVADLLAKQAHTKRLELAVMVAPDVRTRLRGDPGRIRQILTNLVGNAIKFTEAGEVMVRVLQVDDRPEAVVVRVEVVDTGIGIAPAVRSALFDPFSQADSSTTRTYGGSGLGLAISRQLVELMGGEIGVDSEPGRGSTFSFAVPLAKQTHEPTSTPERRDLRGLNALVVDDNATNRDILGRHVASLGMAATVADGGPGALEALRAATRRGEAFDVVLIDMDMPGMNGLGLAEAIGEDPALASIPLLLLTSAAVRGAAAEARRAGFSAYLTKPVRQSQLFAAIATVLGETTAEAGLVTQHTLAEARASSRPWVLVAEDNAVNQKVAVAMLAKLGYRADVVANGAEALDALSRIPYGAVLMDCQMPEMDGYAATTELRRREKGSAHLPVIAMTAGAMTGDRQRCLDAGMDDYLAKPVNMDEMATVLRRWTEPDAKNRPRR